MVYTGKDLGYTELKAMSLEEYTEAIEAKILYNEWRREK